MSTRSSGSSFVVKDPAGQIETAGSQHATVDRTAVVEISTEEGGGTGQPYEDWISQGDLSLFTDSPDPGAFFSMIRTIARGAEVVGSGGGPSGRIAFPEDPNTEGSYTTSNGSLNVQIHTRIPEGSTFEGTAFTGRHIQFRFGSRGPEGPTFSSQIHLSVGRSGVISSEGWSEAFGDLDTEVTAGFSMRIRSGLSVGEAPKLEMFPVKLLPVEGSQGESRTAVKGGDAVEAISTEHGIDWSALSLWSSLLRVPQ